MFILYVWGLQAAVRYLFKSSLSIRSFNLAFVTDKQAERQAESDINAPNTLRSAALFLEWPVGGSVLIGKTCVAELNVIKLRRHLFLLSCRGVRNRRKEKETVWINLGKEAFLNVETAWDFSFWFFDT